MRIVRTARAEEDLIDIWTFIALDDGRAADRVLDEFERKSTLLASNPHRGWSAQPGQRIVFDLVSNSHRRCGSSPLCSRATAFEGTGMKMLIGKMPPVSISLERGVG
jgi:hypothetical protein